VITAMIFVVVPLSVIVWRCTKCKGYLGRSFSSTCMHCGTNFSIEG
jgi:hypothetical protein